MLNPIASISYKKGVSAVFFQKTYSLKLRFSNLFDYTSTEFEVLATFIYMLNLMNLMMKKLFLIMAIIGILAVSFVSADVIPGNSHSLSRCDKFVNLNEFSDIVLIGYYTGPMVDTYEAYQIENNDCLEKGYKFNSLNIYWATKEKFDALDIENLNVADLTLLLEDVEPYGGYVDESNPLIKETIEYSIAGFKDGNLIIYKSKQTSEYNDGQSNKVETFDKPNVDSQEPTPEPTPTPEPEPQPEPTPEPTPEPQSFWSNFWSKIGCFFKTLFGGSC